MDIQGWHHITLVTADARRNADFYTRVLGLRLVKKTVNFDDPGSYHLYYGNAEAAPGSLLTFFEWPHAPRGHPGLGGTHHVALTVKDRDDVLRWKRRLTDLGLRVDGPYDRVYFTSIYFRDPDGTILEIASEGPGFGVEERAPEDTREETWPEAVPAITPSMTLTGIHHISATGLDLERSHAFYGDLLGLTLVKKSVNRDDASMPHWFWGDADGRPGTLMTYFEGDPDRMHRAKIGYGQTHHFAFAVADDAAQEAWRQRLVAAGLSVSPVRDRVYFRSIYTQDPDGHIVELATRGPGFAVDEAADALGTTLMLPPWLEGHRSVIEQRLQPLTPTTSTT